jgi:hypothetical protein
MADLSDMLKHAVDDVPEFDPAALATRRRRQRRHQATGAASVLVVIATAMVLLLNTGGGGVVVSTRRPAATSTESSGDTSTTPVSDTIQRVTTIPPGPIPTTTTTTIPGARAPQIGDFTGTLTASGATVHVGEGVDLELRIHNASNDAIDTSRDERPNLELYCDVMQNPGPPKKIGVAYYDGWYLPESTMQPGADGVITGQFVPSTDFIGRASCQAVVMQLPLPRFFPEWDAITAIDPVVITVLPAQGPTTTTASTLPPTNTGVPTTP